MNFKILTTASAAALLFAGAAMAQTAPAPAEDHSAHAGAQAEAAAPASFTDAELLTFARVVGQLQAIAGESGGELTAEQQTQMAGIVEGSGLTIQRFNEISTAVSADTALQGRVVALLQAQAGASGSAGAGAE